VTTLTEVAEALAAARTGQEKNPQLPTKVYVEHVGFLLGEVNTKQMILSQWQQAIEQIRRQAVSLDDYAIMRLCETCLRFAP
jgi:hypothetical protein